MREFTPVRIGVMVTSVISDMIAMADQEKDSIRAEINGQEVVVKPGDEVEQVWVSFQQERDRRQDEYVNSDEHKEQVRKAEEAERKRRAAFEAAILSAPPKMTVKDEKSWLEIVEMNGGPNGACGDIDKWARLMEARINKGERVADCAEETAALVDSGWTMAMYSWVISVMSGLWVHGEELRLWHNLTYGGKQGEEINKTEGAVIDPAVVILSPR